MLCGLFYVRDLRVFRARVEKGTSAIYRFFGIFWGPVRCRSGHRQPYCDPLNEFTLTVSGGAKGNYFIQGAASS